MADTDKDTVADGGKYEETENAPSKTFTDAPGGKLPAATVHREQGAPMTTTA